MIIHLGQNVNAHIPVKPISQAGVVTLNYDGFLSLLNTQLGLAYLEISHNRCLIEYLGCLHKKDRNRSPTFNPKISINPKLLDNIPHEI